VQKRYDDIRRLGGEVLAVAFVPANRVAAFLAVHPLPFPALADPDRTVYEALGLGRTSWLSLLRPVVLVRFVWLMLKGWLPTPQGAGEDVLQLGGDFIVDPQGRLAYAHRSSTATDRPAVGELLDAIRAAAGERGVLTP
jgi:peroxiredoxin